MATSFKTHSWEKLMEQATDYVVKRKPNVSSPNKIAEFMRPLCVRDRKEKFYVLCLNVKNDIIHFEVVSIGTVDNVMVHPRDVFRAAIVHNASRIAVVHNHPSGGTQPSKLDENMTKKLVDGGKILNIEVVDHVIISKGEMKYYSFRENYCMPI